MDTISKHNLFHNSERKYKNIQSYLEDPNFYNNTNSVHTTPLENEIKQRIVLLTKTVMDYERNSKSNPNFQYKLSIENEVKKLQEILFW